MIEHPDKSNTEIKKLEASQPAYMVAGRHIGRHGLIYLTVIVLAAMLSAYILTPAKLTPVIGLVTLVCATILNVMLQIISVPEKTRKPPEYDVIERLIDKLDKVSHDVPASLKIDGHDVTITKGNQTFEHKIGEQK